MSVISLFFCVLLWHGIASAQPSCLDWYELGHKLNDEERFQETIDTMKAYIYSCHTPWIKPGFTPLTGAVQYVSTENQRWLDYREWLKTVVYLNTIDNPYYCAVGISMLSTLHFEELSTLKIGTAQGGATLVAMPNFECWFGSEGQDIGHTLRIGAGSAFHFYGAGLGPVGNWVGQGTIALEGGSSSIDASGDLIIVDPARLFLHGGSKFVTPEGVSLFSTAAEITLLNDQNILPLSAPPTVNPDAPATFELAGLTSLVRTQVTDHARVLNTSFLIKHNSAYDYIPQPGVLTQLYISSCRFQFPYAEGGGMVKIVNPNGYNVYGPVHILGSKFFGFQIAANEPVYNFSITSCEFESIPNNFAHKAAIWLENGGYVYPSQYPQVSISQNDFGTFRGSNADGIFIRGFYVTSKWDQIDVHENDFTSANGRSDNSPAYSAIHFVNTSGNVIGNTVTGTYYRYGILNEHEFVTDPTKSSTLICNNVVTYCLDAGIRTSNYRGYAKQNVLAYNQVGHWSGPKDQAQVLFSSYRDNAAAGLHVDDDEALVDLRGVHSKVGSTITNDYAGYNDIKQNNPSGNVLSAQITLGENASVRLGALTDPSYSDFGKNDVITAGSSHNLLAATVVGSAGNIDNNYWGGYTPSTAAPDTRLPNVDFERPGASLTWAQSPSFSVSCGVSTQNYILPAGELGESAAGNDCERLFEAGGQLDAGGAYQMAYDTLKHYIHTCAADQWSYRAFSFLDGANGSRDTVNTRYLEYREWLLSVLYLNTKVEKYWCADLGSLMTTFNYIDPVRGFDINGVIAVLRYAVDSGRCLSDTAEWNKSIVGLRGRQYERWLDTVQNNDIPQDTTLPSLEEIGFGILRQRNAASAVHTEPPVLAEFSVETSANPFAASTSLRVKLEGSAVVDLNVFDQLGRSVYSVQGRIVLPRGSHAFLIDGSDWSSGTYYARVSLLGGQAKTVKLIKE